ARDFRRAAPHGESRPRAPPAFPGAAHLGDAPRNSRPPRGQEIPPPPLFSPRRPLAGGRRPRSVPGIPGPGSAPRASWAAAAGTEATPYRRRGTANDGRDGTSDELGRRLILSREPCGEDATPSGGRRPCLPQEGERGTKSGQQA